MLQRIFLACFIAFAVILLTAAVTTISISQIRGNGATAAVLESTATGNVWLPITSLPASSLPQADVPTGTINGTNAVFTLASAPTGGLLLFRNGLLQQSGSDYTLSGSTVTFLSTAIPQAADSLVAYH
jgi:hypothetical protein